MLRQLFLTRFLAESGWKVGAHRRQICSLFRQLHNAIFNIVIEEIGPKLRIEDLREQAGQDEQEHHRHDGEEYIGDDQAVSQTPHQLGAPAAPIAVDHVKGGQQAKQPEESGTGQIVERIRYRGQAEEAQAQRKPVKFRQAFPEGLRLISRSAHGSRGRRNTLPDSVGRNESLICRDLRKGRIFTGAGPTPRAVYCRAELRTLLCFTLYVK